MAVLTIVDTVKETLAYELDRDEKVVLMGQDVGKNGGVFRATVGLQERFGADRVVDTPLSEGGIVGTAVGVAASGMVPIAEIQFLGFTLQAFEQIVAQAARIRTRSHGSVTCPLTIRSPFGGNVRAPELHSDDLAALFVHSQGLKVVAPATAADTKGLLQSAIRDPDPVLVLEPLRGYRGVKDEVPDGDALVPIGEARVAREGNDVTVIAYSMMVHTALDAAGQAEKDGIDVEVIDLRTLAPLDLPAITRSVEKTGRAVVVHEAPKTGGLGGEIVASIVERAFLSLEAPIERVAGYDVPFPMPQLESYMIPDTERVLAAIRRVASF
jgi:pyruvate dehydrogenase E1 component beta subunit